MKRLVDLNASGSLDSGDIPNGDDTVETAGGESSQLVQWATERLDTGDAAN